MSELTVLDPIEKLFANARGQICDKFRVNKLKRKLRIIGDITSLTEEQFVSSFGSDSARIVGNRLRKNGVNYRNDERCGLSLSGSADEQC